MKTIKKYAAISVVLLITSVIIACAKDGSDNQTSEIPKLKLGNNYAYTVKDVEFSIPDEFWVRNVLIGEEYYHCYNITSDGESAPAKYSEYFYTPSGTESYTMYFNSYVPNHPDDGFDWQPNTNMLTETADVDVKTMKAECRMWEMIDPQTSEYGAMILQMNGGLPLKLETTPITFLSRPCTVHKFKVGSEVASEFILDNETNAVLKFIRDGKIITICSEFRTGDVQWGKDDIPSYPMSGN